MNLERIVKLTVGSVLLFSILTVAVSVFAMAVTMIFGVVFLALTAGIASAVMTGVTSTLETQEKNKNSNKKREREGMTKEERISVLKRKYLENEITENQFEKLVDRELSDEKQKSKQYNRQNVF